VFRRLSNLSHSVLNWLQQRCPASVCLRVGLSGGLDSVVLLHLLAAMRTDWPQMSLQAIHVHHGLSANADAWARFCQQLCQALQIPLQIARVQVQNQGDGIEDAARIARYQVYQQLCQPGDQLLLAHHADDRIETLMMRLRRGAGLRGLAGMQGQRWLDSSRQIGLLRPLLDIPRQQLLSWAQARALQWVEDESNQDLRYERNWWRQQLLPQIYGRFPAARSPLLRSLQRLQQDREVLDLLLQERLQPCVQKCHWPLTAAFALNLEAVLQQPEMLHTYLLRGWLELNHCQLPDERHLLQLWQDMVRAGDDRQPQALVGSCQIRRFRGCLYLLPARLPEVPAACVARGSDNQEWAGGRLVWQDAAGITDFAMSGTRADAAGMTDSAMVGTQADAAGMTDFAMSGTRADAAAGMTDSAMVGTQADAQGLRIQPAGRPHKQLGQIWQEFGIPPWLRPYWPLLIENGKLLLVAGLVVSAERPESARRLSWQP
jgi:tRNA(Ile)-lysidine synthase